MIGIVEYVYTLWQYFNEGELKLNIDVLRGLNEAESLAREDKLHGFYYLAEEAYHKSPGMNQSSLKEMVPSERNRKRSPAHFREKMLAPPTAPTDSMIFGSAFHAAVLEPELFDDRFVVRPAGAVRTQKKGLAKYIEFAGESLGMDPEFITVTKTTKLVKKVETEDFVFTWDGKEHNFKAAQARVAEWEELPKPIEAKSLLTTEARNRVMTMADAVQADPRVQKLMDGAACEVSAYAELHGVPCRGRFDLVRISDGVIADFKTCEDASDRGFEDSIMNWDYDFQAALYCKLFEVITGRVPVFIIIAVEKNPPFALNIFHMQPGWLHIGGCRYREALHLFSDCMAKDIWPAYSQKIIHSEAPEWLLRKEGLV